MSDPVHEVDRFVRHRNVVRYNRLLEAATDDSQRKFLLKLIAAEKQTQKDEGDPPYLY
jgi:hypothetical protein